MMGAICYTDGYRSGMGLVQNQGDHEVTTPAIWIAPDADLTERQQRVFAALVARETIEFKSLNQCSAELGDASPTGIYQTIEILDAKGLVEPAEHPWIWRVRWLHKPAVYVRQGRREGWVSHSPAGGTMSTVCS